MVSIVCNIILLFWIPNFCFCFANYLQAIAETVTFQYFYQIHQKSFSQCFWFLQAQQACKTHQISLKQARLAKQQQQVEQARLAKQHQEKKIARIAKERAERFACKRCFVKFASNIKLHVHVREHHTKKLIALSTSFFSFTFSLTVVSPPVSPKSSRLLISIARLSPISPPISPQISISKLAQKIYMIVNDLFHIFVEKFKPINLFHRQNRFFYSFVNKTFKFCISIYLFVFLSVKSTKIENLTLYHDSAKRRFAYHVSFRFFFFGFFVTHYRCLPFLWSFHRLFC